MDNYDMVLVLLSEVMFAEQKYGDGAGYRRGLSV